MLVSSVTLDHRTHNNDESMSVKTKLDEETPESRFSFISSTGKPAIRPEPTMVSMRITLPCRKRVLRYALSTVGHMLINKDLSPIMARNVRLEELRSVQKHASLVQPNCGCQSPG
jgi:hypothetical protein